MAEVSSDEDESSGSTNKLGVLIGATIHDVYGDDLQELEESNSTLHNEIQKGYLTTELRNLTTWIIQQKEKTSAFMSDWSNDGRIGPDCVEFVTNDDTIGKFRYHDNPRQMTSILSFSTVIANTCIFKGKWQYEVILCSKGVMQIGWATNKCDFSEEKGVGDTPDSYAYDGNRQRRWNVATYHYGEIWNTGDVISCTIDLDEGNLSYFRNGRHLGAAFTNVKIGPGIVYIPAVSMALYESMIVNFGSTPFYYPQTGYMSLVAPPVRDTACAKVYLEHFKKLADTTYMWSKSFPKQPPFRSSLTCTAVQMIGQCIGHELAPYLMKRYIINHLVLPYLGSVVPLHAGLTPPMQDIRKAHIIFDLLLSILEEQEMVSFLRSLISGLEYWHRMATQDLEFRYQNHSLQLLYVIISHRRMRKCCLSEVLFSNYTLAQFMNIDCVDLSVLKKNFDICYWSDKKGNNKFGTEESYKLAVSTLKESIKRLESLQVAILRLLLAVDDEPFHNSSRFIFLNKFRLFLFQQTNRNRHSSDINIPMLTSMNLCDRLFEAVRCLWREEMGAELTGESMAPRMFYDGSLNYFELHRVGGQESHLMDCLRTLRDRTLKSQENNGMLGYSNLNPSNSSHRPSTSKEYMDDSPTDRGGYWERSKAESRRALEHIVDSVVMLYHNGGHKFVTKVIAQTELLFENITHYNKLNERLQKLPPNTPSLVCKEFETSISVLRSKLSEQVYQHLWNEVSITNADCFQKMLNMFSVITGLLQKSSRGGLLFSFVPAFYLETIALISQNMKLLFIEADEDADDLKLLFLGGKPMEDQQWKDYRQLLSEVGEFLCSHFSDHRIVFTESRETIVQTIASFGCTKPGLRAMESIQEESRMKFIRHILIPYNKCSWAQKNWILVQFWRGKGFGFRFSRSPHLAAKLGPIPSHSIIKSAMPISVPCPSDVFLRHVSQYLRTAGDEATKFVHSLLNQLNWAFTELLGMLDELNHYHLLNASYSTERILLEHRHLRLSGTCFDLTLALVRVLEMVVSEVPEIFLDLSLNSARSLLRRLCQLVSQILNRTICSSSSFRVLVHLDVLGLENIDYYPLLTAVAGIMINLFKDDGQSGKISKMAAIDVLVREASFEVSSLCSLLGVEPPTNSKPLELCPILDSYQSLKIRPRSQQEESFTFLRYPETVSREELQSLVDLINYLQMASTEQEKMDADVDDFCTICYANLPNAVFYPCKHTSCASCISHYLMNGLQCFYCKAQIEQVINQDTGTQIYDASIIR